MTVRYSPEIAEQICDRIAAGESLRAICRDAGMPCEKAVRKWAEENTHNFGPRYAQAREAQAEYWVGEIVEISDSVRGSDNAATVQAARLATDSRKWIASKMLPKTYGDRVEHVGAGGGNLIPNRHADPLRVAHAMLLLLQTASPKQLAALEDKSGESVEDGSDDGA